MRCDSDLTATWPNELEDSNLFWASNEEDNLSGPKFRLFSQVDVRIVEPNTVYNCKYAWVIGSEFNAATKSKLVIGKTYKYTNLSRFETNFE